MKNFIDVANQTSFFISSQTLDNKFQSFESFLNWFDKKKEKGHFEVQEIPFNELDQWHFTPNNENLVHKSGKFFSIEGLRVQTNFGTKKRWTQPIINQPEIGILGILTKVFNGTRYFLMQAKMEPGNVNILQLSPTVQATKSNFSRVHNGKLPAYLEYFLNAENSMVLIDQLQTEQGARFLRKRNRNIVIEVANEVEVLDDFCWLTLGELKKLLQIDNFVNMDARSVISIIPLIDDDILLQTKEIEWKNITTLSMNEIKFKGNNLNLLYSVCCQDSGIKTKDQIISWYTDQKVNNELFTEHIPLSQLENWMITENNIYNTDRYFSVIGVKVQAGTREVMGWTQPLIKDCNLGLLGFLIKKINGVYHFLVQAKVEPGNIDVIELSPSVSCSNFEYLKMNKNDQPLFFYHFLNNNRIIYDTIQSEEGGRFYHIQNRNMIVELDENEELDIPSNYIWMTLNQMMDFMRYSMFNIEARSIISSINFFA